MKKKNELLSIVLVCLVAVQSVKPLIKDRVLETLASPVSLSLSAGSMAIFFVIAKRAYYDMHHAKAAVERESAARKYKFFVALGVAAGIFTGTGALKIVSDWRSSQQLSIPSSGSASTSASSSASTSTLLGDDSAFVSSDSAATAESPSAPTSTLLGDGVLSPVPSSGSASTSESSSAPTLTSTASTSVSPDSASTSELSSKLKTAITFEDPREYVESVFPDDYKSTFGDKDAQWLRDKWNKYGDHTVSERWDTPEKAQQSFVELCNDIKELKQDAFESKDACTKLSGICADYHNHIKNKEEAVYLAVIRAGFKLDRNIVWNFVYDHSVDALKEAWNKKILVGGNVFEPGFKNDYKQGLLEYAINCAPREKNYEMIDFLISSGCPIDDKAFNKAIMRDNADILAKLIKAKDGNDLPRFVYQLRDPIVTTQPFVDKTALRLDLDNSTFFINFELPLLHYVVAKNKIECLKYLLDNQREAINTSCDEVLGLTPLHLAVLLDYGDCVSLLLASGADTSIKTPIDNWTPLFFATKYANDEIFAKILAKTTDDVMNTLCYTGFGRKGKSVFGTALWYAEHKKYQQQISLLGERKAQSLSDDK